ncbi:hypothetical protein HMPREF9345_04817, partial [Escherichia coli MS 107-1]
AAQQIRQKNNAVFTIQLGDGLSLSQKEVHNKYFSVKLSKHSLFC